MNTTRILALIALIALLAGRVVFADVHPPSLDGCDEKRTERLVYDGNPVEALAVAQACLAYHEYRFGRSTSSGAAELASVAHYRYVIAQLFALLGQPDQADAAFIQAENFASFQGLLDPGRLMYSGPINEETRGYILERRGEDNAALEHYFASRSAFAYGRIALIALKTRDDVNARLYARRAAIGGDATGYFVLGSLAEIAGDTAAAWNYYRLAQDRLRALLNQAPMLVDYYAERPRIDEALARIPAAPGQPHIVERDGRKTFVDSTGAIVGQERWPGALALETVRAKQVAYNDWIASQPDLTRLRGVALVPQYPRRFVLVGADDRELAGAIRLPSRIEPTGVLDLDTLAIGYYKAAVEWAELCNATGVTPQSLNARLSPQSFTQGGTARLHAGIVWQLGRAYNALARLRDFLSGVTMHTAAGDVYDALTEARRYPDNMARLRQALQAQGVDSSGLPPAALFAAPPDFMTAHIEPAQLTRVLIDALASRERAARAELFLARALIDAQGVAAATDTRFPGLHGQDLQ